MYRFFDLILLLVFSIPILFLFEVFAHEEIKRKNNIGEILFIKKLVDRVVFKDNKSFLKIFHLPQDVG